MKTENIFARIYEVEDRQVLITKDFEAGDDGKDAFSVKQRTDFDGVSLSMSLGFTEEERRDECFDTYEQKNAAKFLSVIDDLMKS